MNSIQKQKGGLLFLGIGALVLSILSIAGGVALIVNGAKAVAEQVSVGGIVMLVFGVILCILFVVGFIFATYSIFVGVALKATKGSIKQGNIAKEGGTVNMVKCDKCGTELKTGETACSNCGKKVEDMNK